MKKVILSISLAVFGCVGITQSNAQSDASVLMRGGVADANTLMNAYMGPLMKSFGAGLNAGWFQTAKPHGIGGFDVTISTNLTFAPTADQTYDAAALAFKSLSLASSNTTTKAPTIFGESKEGPMLELKMHSTIPDYANPGSTKDTAFTATSFNCPQGLGANMFVVPTAQVSVGVGFGTEVGIRYMPTVKSTDFEIGMFGFAVKHDFKQWIPGMKLMPFDLSAMFGYTSMNAMFAFGANSVKPDTNSSTYYNTATMPAYDNQKIEFKATAWNLNVLVSKKLGPLTPYLGLGYQHSSVSLALTGDYPVTSPNDKAATVGDPSFGKPMKIDTYKDPVNITSDLNGFRATVGVRLKLLLLTIHGDYTFAAYNVASVGLGLNLQSIVPFKL